MERRRELKSRSEWIIQFATYFVLPFFKTIKLNLTHYKLILLLCTFTTSQRNMNRLPLISLTIETVKGIIEFPRNIMLRMKRLTRISETSLATSTTWQIFISCKYFICYDESGNVKIKLLHFVSFCILFVVIINVLFCSEKEFVRKEFFIKLKEKEGQIFIVNSVVFANFVSCVIHYSESVMYLMVCKRTITPLYILTASKMV